MQRTSSFFLTGTLCALLFLPSAQAEIIYGANLIPNGDFESSNVTAPENDGSVNGFVSDYLNITGFWNLSSEGVYAIGDNPSGSPYGNPFFPNGAFAGGNVPTSGFGDHTTGSGLMMIVNGAEDTSKTVWQLANPIAVTAGLTYRFEAWTSTFGLNDGPGESLASLMFQISLDAGSNWQSLGTTFATPGDASWVNTYVDGTFATSANVILRLMNNQSAVGGNDFAIDDLFFGEITGTSPLVTFTGLSADNISATGSDVVGNAIPEPGTWAAAALLVGGAAFLRWRRRVTAA